MAFNNDAFATDVESSHEQLRQQQSSSVSLDVCLAEDGQQQQLQQQQQQHADVDTIWSTYTTSTGTDRSHSHSRHHHHHPHLHHRHHLPPVLTEEDDICDVDLERDPVNEYDDVEDLQPDGDGSSDDSEDEVLSVASSSRQSSTSGTTTKSRWCSSTRRGWRSVKRQLAGDVEELEHNLKKIKCKPGRDCCTKETLFNRIPITRWIQKYRLRELQGDLMAGFTVGLTVIPQSIAYSSLANVPSQYGLYSAFLGSFIYVLFGSTKDITLGPSALQSIVTGSFARSPIEGDATYAIILGLMSGAVQLGLYILGLGVLFDFVSFPVMKAFTTATAITIAVSQIPSWLGLKDIPSQFMKQVYEICKKLPETNPWDFLLGCVCIFFIILFRKLKELKWKKKYRELSCGMKIVKKCLWFIGTLRNVIVIICASVAAYIFSIYDQTPFTLTGYIPPGIPPFHVPQFSVEDPVNNVTITFSEISSSIGIGYALVPLIAVLEAMAIGKPYARKGCYYFDTNQELLPYGLANVLGAFVGGYPVTGTFSRTALNAASGVQTPAGGIVTGGIVLLVLAFATTILYWIPKASLAVVIILAVIDTMTFHKVYVFWKTNKIDLLPWFVTFVLSFVLSIAYSAFIGAAISLIILIYPSFRPKMKVTDLDVCEKVDRIIVIRLNNGFMYPAAEYIKNKTLRFTMKSAIVGNPVRGILIDATTMSFVDSTTVQCIRELLEDLHKMGIPLVFYNLQKQPDRMLGRARPKHFSSAEDVDGALKLVNAKLEELVKQPSISLTDNRSSQDTHPALYDDVIADKDAHKPAIVHLEQPEVVKGSGLVPDDNKSVRF